MPSLGQVYVGDSTRPVDPNIETDSSRGEAGVRLENLTKEFVRYGMHKLAVDGLYLDMLKVRASRALL